MLPGLDPDPRDFGHHGGAPPSNSADMCEARDLPRRLADEHAELHAFIAARPRGQLIYTIILYYNIIYIIQNDIM